MKTCFKCKEAKALDGFYTHKMMADGYLNKCKECAKADEKARRAGSGRERMLSYDRARSMREDRVAARAIYQQTEAGKSAHARAASKYAERHPDRYSARNILNAAVRDKKLKPWTACALPECCAKPQAHHPDYSRPLDVVWLCPSHHKQAHALIGSV